MTTIWISRSGDPPRPAPFESEWGDEMGHLRTDPSEYTADTAFMAHGDAVVVDPPPVHDAATHNAPAWIDGAWTEQPKSNEQMQAERLAALVKLGEDLTQRLEDYFDSVAKAKRYRNTDRLLNYVNSPVPAWKADADLFNDWFNASVTKATSLENAVANGERAPLTWDELLTELDDPPWSLED